MDDFSPTDLKTILHSKRANLYRRGRAGRPAGAGQGCGGMNILLVSQCDKRALTETRRIPAAAAIGGLHMDQAYGTTCSATTGGPWPGRTRC